MTIEVTQKVINGKVYTVCSAHITADDNSSVSTALSGSSSSSTSGAASSSSATTTSSSSSSATTSSSSSSTLASTFSSSCTDGKNDGSIGFLKATGNFLKGVGNFFKGLVCDESGNFSLGQTLKTVAIGAVIAGASILIPGAGTAIALGALGIAGYHGVKAGIDIATAKTDEEAALAWQNMGSAATEGALAYAGAKGTGALTKARNGLKTVRNSTVELYNGYKSAGTDGLKYVAQMQKDNLIASGKNAYQNAKAGAKANWEKAAESYGKTDSHIQKRNAKYDSDIRSANNVSSNSAMSPEVRANATARAQRLTQERTGYNDGVKAAKDVQQNAQGTQSSKSIFKQMSERVTELERSMDKAKSQMTKAEEAYNANPSDAALKVDLETAQSKYYETKGQYEGARDYLRLQQREGVIKIDDTVKTELKTAKDNATSELNTKIEAEKAAKQKYDADPQNTNLKAEYEQAQRETAQARENLKYVNREESLTSNGSSSVGETKYVIRESVKKGFEDNTKQNIFLTLSLAGKGRKAA